VQADDKAEKVQVAVRLVLGKDGKVKPPTTAAAGACGAEVSPDPGGKGLLVVSLNQGTEAAAWPDVIEATVGEITAKQGSGTKGNLKGEGVLSGQTLVIKSGKDDLCKEVLGVPKGPGTIQTDAQKAMAPIIAGAREYIKTESVCERKAAGSAALGRTYELYHLPDGSPACAPPEHISEKDTVVLVTIVPTDAVANVEVVSCEAVPSFRVLGKVGDAKFAGAPQSAVTYMEVKYPRHFKCAEKLSYKISTTFASGTINTPEGATTLTIEPTYRVSVGGTLAFDFGRPPSISLKDRANAAGDGTEKFVSRSVDYSGVRSLVTLTLHPCQMNPKEWTVCDLISPAVAIDPAHLTNGFVVGGVITTPATPLVGIMVGASVFQSDLLADDTNLQPGKVFPGAGDVPKRTVFTKDGVGFFIGLNVNTQVLAQIFAK